MVVYEQVEEYMKQVGLKYIKTPNDFISGLAYRTNKNYALEVANVLNYRAEGAPTDNDKFYELKNDTLESSIYISAAFDGGVFRHIGNIVIDRADMFGTEVLDLACDCGIVSCFMAKCYPDSHFYCVDKNEKAVANAKLLAEKLGLTNIEFEVRDVLTMDTDRQFDTVTSFRTLLDVTDDDTGHLVRIGTRSQREGNFEKAFSPYAEQISRCLKDDGCFISIERYTAEYGWLGWLSALAHSGIVPTMDTTYMRAQDISSTKEYSVTFAQKKDIFADVTDVFNNAMSKDFKSGTGYDGAMAEFALYYDADGEIEFTDVLKKDRVIRQFAFAKSKNGKNMYFEADPEKKKIKYFNDKKYDNMRKDYQKKVDLYSSDDFKVVVHK